MSFCVADIVSSERHAMSGSWILPLFYLTLPAASFASNVFTSKAVIELILQSGEGMWTSKDIRSVYTNAGAVMNVEGNLEQVGSLSL